MRVFNILTILLLVLLTSQTYGQLREGEKIEYSGFFDSYYNRGGWDVIVGTGVYGYGGELCKGLGCNKIKPGITVGVAYKIWPRVFFEANFNYFGLGAEGENPAVSFSSKGYDISLLGQFLMRENIIRIHRDRKKPTLKFKPYLAFGGGYLHLSSIPTITGKVSENLTITSAGINTPVIKGGIGLMIHLNKNFQVTPELLGVYTFSDLVDGTSYSGSLNDIFASFNVKLHISTSVFDLKKYRKQKPPQPRTPLHAAEYDSLFKGDNQYDSLYTEEWDVPKEDNSGDGYDDYGSESQEDTNEDASQDEEGFETEPAKKEKEKPKKEEDEWGNDNSKKDEKSGGSNDSWDGW